MIRCRIIEVDAASGATASQKTRAIHAEILTLGRAAACKVYLPDPRVRLTHASIHRAEDGLLYLESQGGTTTVDGVEQNQIKLEIGPLPSDSLSSCCKDFN